ncbi:MAG TPA: efflux transporter outer membrane subunit [Bryobacteraceae bacterium]|nr:efflux transporter outer membrane subunit [Bryobacteraceae bacterium]
MRLLVPLVLALGLSGCLVGPNYHRPVVAVPGQFPGEPATPQSIADQKWFQLFQDSELQQLVTTALKKNFDVRIAAERVLEARAEYGIQRANLLPTLDAQGSYTSSRTSLIGSFPFPPGTPSAFSYTQAGLQLNWELDLWGRLRRLNEAAKAQYLGTEEARNGVIISLISDVMTTYFSLRELDLELAIGRQNNGIARDNLRLIQLRKDRGAANGLEVHQAEQFLYTTTATIASVERSIGLTQDALNLLLGNAPSEVPRGVTFEQIGAEPIATAPELPAGIPASLIERRPDIREAEDNLIAANAQIGAARALFFPDISLTGFLGSQSRSLAGMFSGPARLESIAPSALLPIFHAGLRAGVRLTEAQEREMLISYQKSIYTGLREVNDALVTHIRTREQRGEEEKLVKALSESVRLSTLRYRGGLDSYLQVLDAERNLFAGQLDLAQLRLLELQSVVQLYRALGGGWQA